MAGKAFTFGRMVVAAGHGEHTWHPVLSSALVCIPALAGTTETVSGYCASPMYMVTGVTPVGVTYY